MFDAKIYFFTFFFHFIAKSLSKESEIRFLQQQNLNSTIDSIIALPNITLPKCVSDADCSFNGNCDVKTGHCECDKSHGTLLPNLTLILISKISQYKNQTLPKVIPLTSSDIQYCNYALKQQMTAFLLSIFVGFGAEHFYLERYSSGAAKLVFYIFCGVLNIFFFIIYKCFPKLRKYLEFIGVFEATYLVCGVIYILLWNVYDWVHIGYGTMLDGKGMRMASWNKTM
jgi:hypothetical protein